MVTMFHYDLPEELMKIGGFTNSEIILYFRYYADTLFKHFADRVSLKLYFVMFNISSIRILRLKCGLRLMNHLIIAIQVMEVVFIHQ